MNNTFLVSCSFSQSPKALADSTVISTCTSDAWLVVSPLLYYFARESAGAEFQLWPATPSLMSALLVVSIMVWREVVRIICHVFALRVLLGSVYTYSKTRLREEPFSRSALQMVAWRKSPHSLQCSRGHSHVEARQ